MRLFKSFIFYLLLFALSLVISTVLVFVLDFNEKFLLHLGLSAGFFLSAIFLFLIFRKKPSYISTFTPFFIYLFICEIGIVAFSPLHSLIPETNLKDMEFVRSIDDDFVCGTKDKVAEAKEFMKDDIDLNSVKIYYFRDNYPFPKLKVFPQNLKASTYGNFIYIYGTDTCITTPTLVHELTHVWQYQKRIRVGPKWFGYWLGYYRTFFTNFGSLYDYGGLNGLSEARSSNKKFRDFGVEQQAGIVAGYYILVKNLKGAASPQIAETLNLYRFFLTGEFKFVDRK